MGQSESREEHKAVDPGPLGDKECLAAMEVFEEHAKKVKGKAKVLDACGFAAALDLSEEGLGGGLFKVASRGGETVSVQEWVRFMGETTRGNQSTRLTHYLCGAAGATSLVDKATGEPVSVRVEALTSIFVLAWRELLSKHHATEWGFDDDDDDRATASTRPRLYGQPVQQHSATGTTADGTTARDVSSSTRRVALLRERTRSDAWDRLEAMDAAPFVESILEAARLEARRETRAREDASVSTAIGSACSETNEGGVLIDLSFVARWCDRHARELADAWTARARAAVFGEYASIFQAPRCLDASDIFGPLSARRAQLLCGLSLAAHECRGDWKRLYASSVDGLSFFRLCHQILGWRGPTVLLFQTSKNAVFGALLDQPWREWHTFFGGSSCFLFALFPEFRVCRPRRDPGARRDFAYLNTKGFGKFRGIALGGSGSDPEAARLVIPESLGDARITVRRSDLTFEPGDIVPPLDAHDESVSIDSIEVWGVGLDAAAIADATLGRDQARKNRAEYVRRAGKVDKAKFLQNSFDREHLLGKTFAGCAPADIRRDRQPGDAPADYT